MVPTNRASHLANMYSKLASIIKFNPRWLRGTTKEMTSHVTDSQVVYAKSSVLHHQQHSMTSLVPTL